MRIRILLCITATLTNNPSLSLRQVTAICILLQLPPEFSDDMIAKAGIRPLPIAEHIAYKMLLRTMYSADLQTCNDLLRAENFEPLIRNTADQEQQTDLKNQR